MFRKPIFCEKCGKKLVSIMEYGSNRFDMHTGEDQTPRYEILRCGCCTKEYQKLCGLFWLADS